MGFFKKLFSVLGFVSDEQPATRKKTPTPKTRVDDSRTKIPSDARIEIVRTWSPVTGSNTGRFQTEPWRGWRDDDIVDEDQVLVHVTSDSNGLDYYRTIMGPFADNAIDSIIDLVNAEFWNSSP